MFGLGHVELIIIGVVAVLLFGSRLPSVARSMGQSFLEFKKGMQNIQDEVYSASASQSGRSSSSARSNSYEDREEATAPKFEPPSGEPHETPREQPEPSQTL